MAHKTFMSYKYNESLDLRDKIIRALGEDAKYYQGEYGFSPNKSDDSDDAIWNYLKDMIWGTTVTIVILSPRMTKSSWIEDEIKYSLRKVKRGDTTSSRNGMVAVIKKINGSCDWIKIHKLNCHGKSVVSYQNQYLFPVIYRNHFNSNPPRWHCNQCRTYDWLYGSYIEYADEDDFLSNPQFYIDNAYNKSLNDASGYDLVIEE